MLEKGLNSWTKYNDLYSALDIWLNKQEHVNSFDVVRISIFCRV
jgi:hypothetical protein